MGNENDYYPDWQDDNCPIHDTKFKKRYVFGEYGDAEIIVFRGCNCAMSVNEASLRWVTKSSYTPVTPKRLAALL